MIYLRVSLERWIQAYIEPVQSRIKQRSRLLDPDLESLVGAFLLGATGCFLTALAAGLDFETDLVEDFFF